MNADVFEDKLHEVISEALDDGMSYDDAIASLAKVTDEVREESEA